MNERSRDSKIRPTKDLGNLPPNRIVFNRQKWNNYIVNSAVDEILLQENQKLSAAKEENENIESDFDVNKLYHTKNMSL